MFIGVFAVMAVLVVGITMSVVKPALRTADRTPASSRAVPANGASSGRVPSASPDQYPSGDPVRGAGDQPPGTLDARLTAALGPEAALCQGQLSVAVRDRSTGAEALSAAGQSVPAVSTAAADILAVLLYQHQQPGAQLTGALQTLAARMIEDGSRAATGRLWRLIGAARGFDAGATALHLPHTVASAADGWRQVTTTAADQLQLLTDLTSAASPLSPAARAADVALMTGAVAGTRTWAGAAASPGTSYAASSGWHAGLTGSIAIVRHGNQKLIVVVLAQGCATRAAGMAVAVAAARAAAAMITTVAPARASHGQPS